MKFGFILSLTFLCFFSAYCVKTNNQKLTNCDIEKIHIQGTVFDEDNNSLIGANVIIVGTTIGTITDLEGRFEIDVPNKNSMLKVSYVGFETKEIKADSSYLTIHLTALHVLEECIVGSSKAKNKKHFSRKDAKSTAKYKVRTIEPSAAALSLFSSEGTTIKEINSSDMMHMDSEDFLVAADMDMTKGRLPKSGQLTAGEWNDLNNWSDWKNLIREKEFQNMSSHWQIYPSHRYPVFITNENGLPVNNCTVQLLDKRNNVLWTALTDNSGKSELWKGWDQNKIDAHKIRVTKGTFITEVKDPKIAEQGMNHIQINTPCKTYQNVDIMFVVDATGSMGDEIDYLRSELSHVIETVKDKSTLNYRVGSVFYKDSIDDYVTKMTPLDNDINKTINFIKTKSAGGGGDFPEAVDAALEEAINQEWTEEAVAKIVFLLLDAPPHHNEVVIKRLQNQIKTAAEKGIKIIPITASGIDRQTEFLMKFMSITTNGTYVFITDDSGIGGSHLKPLVDDFEVEKLNDLLVRLITHYTIQNNCNETVVEPKTDLSFNIFPNPASRFIKIKLDQAADKVIIRSSSGKLILQKTEIEKGILNIKLDNFVPGMYFITVIKNDLVSDTKSLVVVG